MNFDFEKEKEKAIDDFIYYQKGREFLGKYPKEISNFLRVGIERSIYLYYPFLFANLFPAISLKKLRLIALSGSLYLVNLVIIDTFSDTDKIEDTKKLLTGMIFHEESLKLFHSVFDKNSSFWEYFQSYKKEYVTGVLSEKLKHFGKLHSYSEEEMKVIARGKSAISKIIPAALSVLSNEKNLLLPLSSSQDNYHIGFQLYDDLKDWKEDYQSKHYSYLLTRVIELHNLADKINSDNRPNLEDIGKMMYFSGLAEENLKKAEYFYNKALKSVKDLDCLEWKKVIETEIEKCGNWMNDIRKLRLKEIKRGKELKKSKEKELIGRKRTITENGNYEEVIIPLFKDFINFYEVAKVKKKNERINLAEKLLFNTYQDFWNSYFKVFSTNPEKSKYIILEADEKKYGKIIELTQELDFIKVCASALKKCYKHFPVENIPKLYLIIGPHLTGGFWMFLNGEIVIGISLEFWQEKEKSEVIKDIEITIAHEYAHALRNKIIFGKRLIDKIIDEGLAVTFSEVICPDSPLEKHLAFSKEDLDWCQKNQGFLLRMVSNEWFKEDKETLNFYLASGKKFKDWFPVRTGYYLGYKIIETALNMKLSLNNIMGLSSEIILENSKIKKVKIDKKTLLLAINNAIQFLESKQKADGYWEDFRLSVGLCDEWVTGYIGFILSEATKNGIKADHTDSILKKAGKWLMNSEHENGGWGFNKKSGVDADSTSNCLLFLANQNLLSDDDIKRNKKVLIENQNKDGGIGTFCPSRIQIEIENKNPNFPFSDLNQYRGWCSSDTQISAISMLTLLKCGFTQKSSVVRKILGFIIKKQHREGFWNAYWSNGRMLGTTFCISVLSRIKGNDSYLKKAVKWIISIQNKDGSWSNGIEKYPTPYSTSLAITALINCYEANLYKPIFKGVRWLLNNQLKDGSWKSFPLMKVPKTWDDTQLDNPTKMAAAEDQNRLFTTATVLSALSKFYDIYGRKKTK